MKRGISEGAMRIVAVLTILCLTGFTTGCATERVVTVYEPVEVYRDRFVEVPDNLTEPVEIIELPDNGGFRNADTLQLGAAFKAQRVRAEQCNGQLAEIARLNDEQEKE